MLGRLFGKSDKKPSAESRPSLSPGIISAITSAVGARSIPLMPGAAQKAFQLATDPKADARDFVDVIQSDEALSSRIVKIANSVYFDRGQKSSTIEECVTVIGINELRCLLNANTLTDIFPCKHPLRSMLWTNDIATALIARELARSISPQKVEVAFLGGLMHDIGKLLLLQRCLDDYTNIVKQVESSGGSFLEAELDVFPFDHTQVGELIGQRWNFSSDLLEIISHHHSPWDELQNGSNTPSLAAIVKAADTIAHALGLGHTAGLFRLKARAQAELGELWAALGIPSSEQSDRLNAYKRTFETEYELYLGSFSGN